MTDHLIPIVTGAAGIGAFLLIYFTSKWSAKRRERRDINATVNAVLSHRRGSRPPEDEPTKPLERPYTRIVTTSPKERSS